jgi:hypothetical protein
MRLPKRAPFARNKWHDWFAWFPVDVGTEYRWLEIVERKGQWISGGISSGYHWIYEYQAKAK